MRVEGFQEGHKGHSSFELLVDSQHKNRPATSSDLPPFATASRWQSKSYKILEDTQSVFLFL